MVESIITQWAYIGFKWINSVEERVRGEVCRCLGCRFFSLPGKLPHSLAISDCGWHWFPLLNESVIPKELVVVFLHANSLSSPWRIFYQNFLDLKQIIAGQCRRHSNMQATWSMFFCVYSVSKTRNFDAIGCQVWRGFLHTPVTPLVKYPLPLGDLIYFY